MSLIDIIETAQKEGKLFDSSVENLRIWAGASYLPDWVISSISELVNNGEWDELNDRFYRNLAFGTGGMRGRTIGRVSSSVELGSAKADKIKGTPNRAAVGTNVLNDFNIIKATIGLFRYTSNYLKINDRLEQPRFVIAHDVRHFSRHFCELAASTWTKLGGQALIFDGPRSTPQLSFSVREYKANCGAVITASHNPWHDNGFKVYFEDGAQVVSPHANSIVLQVNEVALDEVTAYLEINLDSVVTLNTTADRRYLCVLDEIVLDREVIAAQKPRIVFSPIHGTGAISTAPALRKLGIDVIEVPEQMVQDSNFTTVQSPNPENAEALEMAIARAEDSGADLVVATDPDADRMGVAVRNSAGKMVLLSGNQIGTLLAEYRIATLKESGVLPEEGTQRAALIKTFVTTPMQDALAKWHGLKTVNTLTGFKWLGEKLADYELQMKQRLLEEEGMAIDYDACDLWTRADLLMEYSTFFVVGGEESYGYLAGDKVRDKDANAAVIMICELAAYLKSQEMTFTDYLDSLYLLYGYYEEQSINIYYEGAAGSHKISNILGSYRARSPKKFGDVLVTGFTDFGKDEIVDADGKKIPPQDFYFLELSNGYSYAVRGSGTEPKIKFYVFGRSDVANSDALPAIKTSVAKEMADILELIESDARIRADAELEGEE